MSNRRFIVLLLLGCACAGALLAWLVQRAETVASLATRAALVSLPREELRELSFSNGTDAPFVLRREARAWRLTVPFAADVDAEAVARVLDELTLSPIGDTLTDAELRRLGRASFLRDFQLDPPRAAVTAAVAGGRFERVALGRATPSGQEVYARVEGLGNVFTVPASVLRAIPLSTAAVRRRTLFAAAADDVSAIDVRVANQPVTRLQRDNGRWSFDKEPSAVVDAAALADMLRRLAAARIDAYLTSGDVSAAKSAAPSYGIDVEAGLALTLHADGGASEQVVFGKAAPDDGAATNRVFALVQNGTAVVTLDGALAEICRAAPTALRDLRVFPFSFAQVDAVSLARPDGAVYTLARGTNGVWRLSAPIDAPADAARVEKLLGVLASLRRPDVAPAEGRPIVRVTVAPAATNLAVAVPLEALAAAEPFDELCSRHVFSFDPATVKGVTIRPAAGDETALVRDPVRDAWGLAPRAAEAAAPRGTLSVEAVNRFVQALSDVNAQGVEVLAGTEADRVRCGVKGAGAFLAVAVDFSTAAVPRRNLILGSAAPGGGRYASVGGSDAIFIVSRETVAALAVSLVE